nr:uncharacterized protein LOC129259734 [Lytechinus pictus]
MVDKTDIDESITLITETTRTEGFREKCKNLDIETELQASIAVGMVKLSGSGAYLGDERKSIRTQQMSIIYKLKTFNEELLLRKSKDIMNMDMLSDARPDATHVVVDKDLSASKYEQEFEPYLRKAGLLRPLIGKGVKYIGSQDNTMTIGKECTFVFYIAQGHNEKDRSVFERNYRYFVHLLSSYSDRGTCQFTVVDKEIVSISIWPDSLKETTIEKYVNGTRTSKDLYEEEGVYLSECMLQVKNPNPLFALPRKRTYVKLRCPNALCGNGKCAGDPSKWKCSTCKQYVEYGTSSRQFHCKCGKSNPEISQFRCNDEHHGMRFMKYEKTLLVDELSTLEPMEEVNILILGETGVGKSTWINGIQNYLSFDNLAEAMESNEFPVLIPSSFTLTKDGEQKDIKIGIGDSNEVQEAGKSATKEPRSYVFTIGERRFRLIDTPGIGDSGGIKQDEQNMDNILSFLTNFSKIDAICILLKPNNARLTTLFRFCIQELLVQLHNSAKNNIVFCFTNARQTFYQPGDTLPALNAELEKKNVGIEATKDKCFCFDNEPFRFLACVKNGIQFDEEDIATYSSSWNKSVGQTLRLTEYIKLKLTPHKVADT